MSYYLAIDGGGTKTKVLCADEQGQVVGEGLAGPTNLTATSVGAASFNLREGIRQATDGLPDGWQVTRMVMGLAGMDTPHDYEAAMKVFSQVLSQYAIQDFQLVNDTVIALASGTDRQEAIVLIAGTGTNCYGRNAEGKEVIVGGQDFLLADQGSGYEIGRAVLRYAVKSFDGRIEKTVLEQMVCEYFEIPTIAELKDKVYNPLMSKSEIGSVSVLCSQAFEQGDPIARTIFDHVIEELYITVSVALTRLGLTSSGADLVAVGSVNKIPYIQERLAEKLISFCPHLQIIHPAKGPVDGALKLAINGDLKVPQVGGHVQT